MQLFFRVEGNKKVGLGHLMRCFALAQVALDNQIAVNFICSAESAKFLHTRHAFLGSTLVIDEALPQEDELHQIVELIVSRLDSDANAALVLDGYQYTVNYQSKLKSELGKKVTRTGSVPLVYFDDINCITDFPNHVADMIVNGAESAKSLGYERNAANSKLCLGSGFMSLRSEFMSLPELPVNRRHSLLICFGGADTENHTLALLIALSEIECDIPVRVVSGVAYQHHNDLQRMIGCQTLEVPGELDKRLALSMPVQYIHDAQDMAELMLHSRLAISAAGGSQFELLHCYTPSFLVVVADNQAPATAIAQQQGWASVLDWRDSATVDYKGLAKSLIAKYHDAKHLNAQQQAAINTMKAMREEHQRFGTENILDAIAAIVTNTHKEET
ncbi:UDP-2,4-diacetamido-2,4,6-trideoxy-beta-L-altropyranose hydrolase [Glaciecola sp. MH2013]|uniref:UDP-2,4-diacetamido-2,4, 6-trideoxy-beta-L-altropyranose hydrolase n=1 Tax=Glaciecola sp. MH2013 TaxID=2785524 RepID=UPI00189D94B7|nr:UDP-2,4-diacetamido-2,4,6-trideoxy-beta-L-altropyranose hydrolase [Glaciecola sp. MH2013]MBF7072358.1 UDP-2,4-diacetamido-2,4,6-trideoxy-beta-L-altropyranose hydrolase [Glaciecola sp. MH2013]